MVHEQQSRQFRLALQILLESLLLSLPHAGGMMHMRRHHSHLLFRLMSQRDNENPRLQTMTLRSHPTGLAPHDPCPEATVASIPYPLLDSQYFCCKISASVSKWVS